jgi:hypothetical protein
MSEVHATVRERDARQVDCELEAVYTASQELITRTRDERLRVISSGCVVARQLVGDRSKHPENRCILPRELADNGSVARYLAEHLARACELILAVDDPHARAAILALTPAVELVRAARAARRAGGSNG